MYVWGRGRVPLSFSSYLFTISPPLCLFIKMCSLRKLISLFRGSDKLPMLSLTVSNKAINSGSIVFLKRLVICIFVELLNQLLDSPEHFNPERKRVAVVGYIHHSHISYANVQFWNASSGSAGTLRRSTLSYRLLSTASLLFFSFSFSHPPQYYISI